MVNYQLQELASAPQVEFVKKGMVKLAQITPNSQPQWGIMSAQHMVEHLEEWLGVALVNQTEVPDTEEHFQKMQQFLWNEQPFAPNIPTPGFPEGYLPPLRYASLDAARTVLQQTLNSFLAFFDKNPTAVSFHPVFGNLDQKGWLQYQEKHFNHHLRQFGLI